MRRLVAVLLTIALALPALTLAAGPDTASGLRLVSQKTLPNGLQASAFKTADGGSFNVLGRPGMTVKAERTSNANGDQTLEVSVSGGSDKNATPEPIGSTVRDLIAAGVDPEQAAQFAQMDTLDGKPKQVASTDASALFSEPVATAVSTSTTTPYSRFCLYGIRYQNGLINGQGCSTVFLVGMKSSGDWYLNSKYLMSMHSSDTDWFNPYRLFANGWSIGWTYGNAVYDWDPNSVIRGDKTCPSRTVSGNYAGFGISVSSNVCPDKVDVWNLSSRRSGSKWSGCERGQDWEAALGTQGAHSPPDAAPTYTSVFTLSWGRINGINSPCVYQ